MTIYFELAIAYPLGSDIKFVYNQYIAIGQQHHDLELGHLILDI